MKNQDIKNLDYLLMNGGWDMSSKKDLKSYRNLEKLGLVRFEHAYDDRYYVQLTSEIID